MVGAMLLEAYQAGQSCEQACAVGSTWLKADFLAIPA